jgi:hypothetical protein
MSDHWGGFDHHDDVPEFSDIHDLPDTPDLHDPGPDSHDHDDDFGHHDTPAADHHDPDDVTDPPDHHDTLPADDDFPPTLEVGDLPEPVDGFPWVDASTLGPADTYEPATDVVDPHDLAAYAGVDVPEGADPWTVLAASDDPAVAALARWWSPDEQ